MITDLLWFLFDIIIAVGIIEIIFWILTLIFPAPFVISSRIRGLIYALLVLLVIIYAVQHFGHHFLR